MKREKGIKTLKMYGNTSLNESYFAITAKDTG
jgi:hypothetical protein